MDEHAFIDGLIVLGDAISARCGRRVIVAEFSDEEARKKASAICEVEGEPSFNFALGTIIIVTLRQNHQPIYDKLEALNPIDIRWGSQRDVYIACAAMESRGQ